MTRAVVLLLACGLLASGCSWLPVPPFGTAARARTCAGDSATIKVYVADTATDAQVKAARAKVEASPAVDTVEYVSKEQALERARELFKDDPDVMENLPGNPFPAYFSVSLTDPAKAVEVAALVEGGTGIDDVAVPRALAAGIDMCGD